jgi:hypothetical protein
MLQRAGEVKDAFRKARSHDRWAPELQELRRKARRYDEIADGPQNPASGSEPASGAEPVPEPIPGGQAAITDEQLTARLRALDERAYAFRRIRIQVDAAADAN